MDRRTFGKIGGGALLSTLFNLPKANSKTLEKKIPKIKFLEEVKKEDLELFFGEFPINKKVFGQELQEKLQATLFSLREKYELQPGYGRAVGGPKGMQYSYSETLNKENKKLEAIKYIYYFEDYEVTYDLDVVEENNSVYRYNGISIFIKKKQEISEEDKNQNNDGWGQILSAQVSNNLEVIDFDFGFSLDMEEKDMATWSFILTTLGFLETKN